MTRRTLKKAFNKFDVIKKTRDPEVPGLLGFTINGKNAVEVNNRSGYVWVRLRSNANEVIQAYNDQVSPVYGLPVVVIRDEADRTKYKIKGRDLGTYQNWGSSPYLPRHGNQHSFNPDAGGGGDVVFIFNRQFMPLAIQPSGTNGAGCVLVQPYAYYQNVQWKYAGGTGTASFLPYKPTGSSARMVLVYLDESSNPNLLAGDTYFAGSITGNAAVLPYVPTALSSADIPLGAVRLVSGTSAILWDNIYDLRPLIVSDGFIPTGTAGHTIQDDGTPLANRSALNFVGSNFVVYNTAEATNVSGTAVSGGGGSNVLPIQDDSIFKVTGSAISFDKDLIVTVSGTVAHVEVPAGTFASGSHTHPLGSSAVSIFEDSTFKTTGSSINFTNGFDVVVSGTVAHIDVPGYDERRYLAAYNYFIGAGTIQYRIGIAKSPNLRDWKIETEPAINLGSAGQWDSFSLQYPYLVNVDGILYCYYTGVTGSNYIHQIGLARSYDEGRTWTKYASNPILVAGQAWEINVTGQVFAPKVIYDREEPNPAKRWKMWYAGGQWGAGGIGYAYSSDGLSWTKYAGNPVVSLGTGGQWDDAYLAPGAITKRGNRWVLFYNGNNGSSTWQGGIATFTDPESSYVKSPLNPLLVSDGITTTITVNMSAGSSQVTVTNANIFPIGAAVWIYDNSNRYLSRIKSITSSTVLEVYDPAPVTITTTGGNVRSAAYNSIWFHSYLYDGGHLIFGTNHQPDGAGETGVHEIGTLYFADNEIDKIRVDYKVGNLLPITVAESQSQHIARENPGVIDLYTYSDRFEPFEPNIENDTIWQAKGNLLVASGSSSAGVLPVGTDGYILTADNTQPLGIKWASGTSSSSPSASIPTYPAIYDNGAFIATGTHITFDQNLSASISGSYVSISAPITTYFRVGQPNPLAGLTGLFWQVPDLVFASGSLAVSIDGLMKTPGINYQEQLWVSGTYQYFSAPATGTVHLVMYGVPCASQTQPATGTAGSPYQIADSNSVLLLDSNSVQILDSNG